MVSPSTTTGLVSKMLVFWSSHRGPTGSAVSWECWDEGSVLARQHGLRIRHCCCSCGEDATTAQTRSLAQVLHTPVGGQKVNKRIKEKADSLFIMDFFFLSIFFLLFRAEHMAYGSSQARVQIGAAAAGLHHRHINTGSEPHFLHPQVMATPDP